MRSSHDAPLRGAAPKPQIGLDEDDTMPERRTSERPISERPTPSELATALAARQPEFLGFLERRLGDRALAQDILQDAFVRSLDKLADLRDPGAAVAWFYRTLRNASADHARRGGSSRRALEKFATELEVARAGRETHDQICRCVAAIADELKPEYSAAIRRIDVEGVAVKDYAAEEGITSNNAGVRVFRARAALREKVTATCGACASRGCVDCTCGR